MATPDDDYDASETYLLQARKLLRQQAPVAEVLRVLKQHHPLDQQPSSPFAWASWSSQERMHRTLLCDPVHDVFPLAPWYRASFIRRLCLDLEEAVAQDEEGDGEVIEPILRELNVLLSQPTLKAEPGELAACFVTFECPVIAPMYVEGDSLPSQREQQQHHHNHQRHQTLATRIAPKENAVGLKLWEACYVLTEALLTHPELCQGRDVVELGAGVGLLGLVAAYCLGAASVTMTDVDEKVLLFLRANVECNAAAAATLLAADIAAAAVDNQEEEAAAAAVVPIIEVAALDWSQPAEYQALLDPPSSSKKEVKQKDRTILAADCIYDQDVIPAFVDVLVYSLRPPGSSSSSSSSRSSRKTTVLVASTMRNPETYAYFQEVVKEKGLVMENMTTMLGSLTDPASSYVSSPFYCPNRAAVRLCTFRLQSDEDENDE